MTLCYIDALKRSRGLKSYQTSKYRVTIEYRYTFLNRLQLIYATANDFFYIYNHMQNCLNFKIYLINYFKILTSSGLKGAFK